MTMIRKMRRFCTKKTMLQVAMGFVLFIIFLLVKRLICEMIGYMPSAPGDQLNRNFDKYVTKYQNNYWKKTDSKKILVWTPFFGKWGLEKDVANAVKNCPASCVVTKDRSEIQSSDALVFHANDLWKYKGLLATVSGNVKTDMPDWRSPNQVWAVVSWEPMIYMWGDIEPHTFNWTMVYRRESSIYNPFTGYRRKTEAELQEPYVKETRNYFMEKKKFATTLVSNCMDHGRRYRTIRELQKYIELDYFGRCSGNINCPAGVPTAECGKKYMKDYKFYLAFENSYCRDYVSEKFWNALDRRQIPVIAAPKYNLEMIPKNSYLNVFDFPSIKALANRMIEIASNETLFNSYFDWLSDYKVDSTSVYCKLCMELHANKQAQSYNDIEAWIKDDICYKSTTWSQVSGFFDRLLFDLGLS